VRDLEAGWGFPLLARKAHYFEAGEIVSACGKWMFSGVRDNVPEKSSSDCVACRKKLEEKP